MAITAGSRGIDRIDEVLKAVAGSLQGSLRAGDQVYFDSAGAYTTVYASGFNGFDIPATRCVPA